MDHRSHNYHHRQSLKPVAGVTSSASSLASRYGLSGSGGRTLATSSGSNTGLSSSVVSFMRKFVTKATPSGGNSIDSSFEKYQQQQQQLLHQSRGQSPTRYANQVTGIALDPHPPSTSHHLHSDTGYSSNANSPVTTPTVCSSSISTSPVPPLSSATSNLNTCSPTLSLGSLASLGSSSYYQVDSSASSRPSSTIGSTTMTSTTTRGPFFSKIRAKMASTFQSTMPPGTPQSQQSSTSNSPLLSRPDSVALEGKPRSSSISSTCSQMLPSPVTGTSVSMGSSGGTTQRPPKLSMLASSSSSLTNSQLTAHLTEEERNILQKVFQKEEEFRELALKNFAKNVSSGDMIECGLDSDIVIEEMPPSGPLLITNSPVTGVSHLSANLLDPVAAAVHRRRSSAIMSADATGLCRICRKVIMKNESAHRCSNCHELVCDDCSSYSSREESKYWMCSFCRRRGSHFVLTQVVTSTTLTTTTTSIPTRTFIGSTPAIASVTSSVSSSKLPAFCKTESSSGTLLTAAATNSKRKLSYSECYRPSSSLELHSARQSSLDLQKSQPISTMVSNGRKMSQLVDPLFNTKQQSNTWLTSSRTVELDSHNMSTSSQHLLDSNENAASKNVPSKAQLNVTSSEGVRRTSSAQSVLSPSGNNGRPRIYSLSDDEEFLSDEEDDEEEDEELDDNIEEGEDEEENRAGRDDLLSQHKLYELDSRCSASNGKSPIFTSNGKKRAKTRKNSHLGLTSPHKDYADHYGHVVGGPSHGTLASVPVETLKRQRSAKKKKKKLSPFSCNSDDELINYSTNKVDDIFVPTMSNNNGQMKMTQDASPSLSQPSQSSTKQLNVEPAFKYSNMSNMSASSAAVLAKIISPKPSRQMIASKWVRLSRKAGSFSRNGCPESFYGSRHQQSLESSDASDFRYSPPQDSLTPSSEYSRSPRESADSEMLGLSYSSLAIQRRSIPSVLVDVGDGSSHYLSTKDCYARRGSTGRALPKIPEPSRSMLDLPHSRKSSQHSLDIPMEQPRRASAPEGENIRIVIDEVADVGSSHQELRIDADGSASTQANHPSSKQVQMAPHQTTYQKRMKYQLTRAASIVTHYERIVLHRDKNDHSNRTRGFGVAIVGGKLNDLDGMLYAFVSWVKPGDTADKLGLKTNDKILEWSGKSLVNCSYEQVCHIMDTSGDSVELIVESMVKCDPATQQQKRRQSLTRQQTSISPQTVQITSEPPVDSNIAPVTSTSPSKPLLRPSSAAAIVCTSTSALYPIISRESGANIGTGSCLRRRLPQIPTSPQPLHSSDFLTDTQILLQVTLDANIRQLSVMIVSARGLEQHSLYSQSNNNETYAQLRLLPEMGFKICQTELSNCFEWNETLIYHQFPLERVENITLDLSIWCTNSTSMYSPRLTSVCQPQISLSADQWHLASTRIPLRSALFHCSEWWPLIPTESTLSASSFSAQQSLDTVPTQVTSSNASSTALVFFQKVPSMEYIGIDNINLLSDQLISRSTPGSRRNSGRSDVSTNEIASLINDNSQQRMLQSQQSSQPFMSTPLPRYRTPPANASSTLSSSTGRHSLDDSSYSNSAGGNKSADGSISLGRSTSLRLVQNRHSVGNLFHGSNSPKPVVSLSCVKNSKLAAPTYDLMMMRRKSSSALGGNCKEAGVSYQDAQLATANYGRSGSLNVNTSDHLSSCNYGGINTDSYQYLLNHSHNVTEMTDQESDLSSDDEVDCLLANSSYTLDSDSKNCEYTKTPGDIVNTGECDQDKKSLQINRLSVVDSNKLSIASDTSRFSGTTSPITPHEDELEEGGEVDTQNVSAANSSRLVPPWNANERRGSFLRRLMPAAAESVMNMMIGQANATSQAHDNTFVDNKTPIVVGELKLGFIMTKGFLEIEVIGARGLPDSVCGPFPPDTYVKIYLFDRGRHLYKRKTRVIACDKNPQYRQTLKYNASIIYGRTLLVSVWEKPRKTFESNAPIGALEINVNQLELHKLTIRWYRLRSFVVPKSPTSTLPVAMQQETNQQRKSTLESFGAPSSSTASAVSDR